MRMAGILPHQTTKINATTRLNSPFTTRVRACRDARNPSYVDSSAYGAPAVFAERGRGR